MKLQIILIFITVNSCFAQFPENLEKFQQFVLDSINTFTEEIQFLKTENSDKDTRIQILEEKVQTSQTESQLQKEEIQKLAHSDF